jgi:hypothetical protein
MPVTSFKVSECCSWKMTAVVHHPRESELHSLLVGESYCVPERWISRTNGGDKSFAVPYQVTQDLDGEGNMEILGGKKIQD